MNLSYKNCTLENIEILVEISRITFVSAFKKQNNPEDFKAYMLTAFSNENLKNEILNPNSMFYLVYDENNLVGYFKLNVQDAQTESLGNKSVEVERIYVLEEFQGRQIGKQMLFKIIEMAEEEQMDFLWLGVWEMNTSAIRFYERYGFVKFGAHSFFIGKDKQTDWLMRLDLV